MELVCQIGILPNFFFSLFVTLIYTNLSYSWEEYINAQCREYYIPEILHPEWKRKITLNGTLFVLALLVVIRKFTNITCININ